MTHLDERALEAATAAVAEEQHPLQSLRTLARAAVTAYQAALPPPVSPELIAKLNALASRLTEMGEYDAVDLIDTVVARLTPLPAPPAAQDPRP
jgi:hypothetical protein